MCRKLKLVYLEDVEIKGINAYRFTPATDTFANPSAPEGQHNKCYCIKKNITECNADGLLDISSCSSVSLGAPMVISSPHFYGASQSVKSKFDGLKDTSKNQSDFRTLVDIEPVSWD